MNTRLNSGVFLFIAFIINIIFLAVISISLYRILCRPDLDIFFTQATLLNERFTVLYSECHRLYLHSERYKLSSIWIVDYDFYLCEEQVSVSLLSVTNVSMRIIANCIVDMHGLQLPYAHLRNFTDVVEVKFFTKVNSFTHLEFYCLQDSIFLVSNDTALVFFRLATFADKELSCIVVFLVSPSSLMPSLTKLQCFCFDNIFISSVDSIELPVIFSIDRSLISFFNKKLNFLFFYLLLEK